MRLRPVLLPILILSTCLANHLSTLAAAAQEPFRLFQEARFFMGMESGLFWLGGEFLIPSGGRPGSGTKVEAASELGVDQGEAVCMFLRGEVLDNHLVDADYMGCSPSGVKKIHRTFRFHNRTYKTGELLETRLDLSWFRLCYAYKVSPSPFWWVAPRIGCHHVICGTTIHGETKEGGLQSNNRILDGTYPVLGLEARYLLPHGFDLGLELEGIHMVSRGYLWAVRSSIHWEAHPDVRVVLSASCRAVHYIEDNQPLNNEWTYVIPILSAGVAFGF